jgi:hypothetical protein
VARGRAIEVDVVLEVGRHTVQPAAVFHPGPGKDQLYGVEARGVGRAYRSCLRQFRRTALTATDEVGQGDRIEAAEGVISESMDPHIDNLSRICLAIQQHFGVCAGHEPRVEF